MTFKRKYQIMEATDLMIHDWVLDDNDNPIQVTTLGVLGGDVIGVLYPFSSVEKYYANNVVALSQGAAPIFALKPAPINSNFLKHNGFEENKDAWDENEGNKKKWIRNDTGDGEHKPYGIIAEGYDEGRWDVTVRSEDMSLRATGINTVAKFQDIIRAAGLVDVANDMWVLSDMYDFEEVKLK